MLAIHGKGWLMGGAFLVGFLAAGFIDHRGEWLGPSVAPQEPMPSAATDFQQPEEVKRDGTVRQNLIDEHVEDWLESRTVWR